jgi:hypothetical protein
VARGARRERGFLPRRHDFRNFVEHGVSAFQYVVVPKTHHLIAFAMEPIVAPTISRTIRMLATINFDDELLLEADEVDDVRTDGSLPFELQIQKTMSA